jgi:hypothetical protein
MAASWEEHASRGNLTVKGRRASGEQAMHAAMIRSRCVAKGSGDTETVAGAIATAIQESELRNLRGGDRDSLGLYQQRPSQGWGSVAQISNPTYAIDKFLSLYIPYRRQGMGWLQASHRTQRSAHPNAPAAWFAESTRAAKYYGGAGADASVAGGLEGSDGSITREKPYEFSRGSPDKPDEDSWTCIGRLADEVKWRRYEANGRIWFASDDWIVSQAPVYRLREGARGVLEISFDYETRKEVAELTARVIASRYQVSPGQVIEVADEGPANGRWILASTRQFLTSPVTELTLRRPQPKLPEPAAETETIQVAGTDQQASAVGGTGGDGNASARSIGEASNLIRQRFPRLRVTSTYRPGGTSYHAANRAHDLAADVGTMRSAAEWINQSGLWRSLVEGIYNAGGGSGWQNLSVKNKAQVPASFWGSGTWAGHRDHLHIAV